MKTAICDDESYWRGRIRKMLDEYQNIRHLDVSASFFENGAELLKCKDKFDIIFMDYQMDDINGIETARNIRAANDGCTIIFISAYTEVAFEAFEVDTFRFLKKPVDKEKLFDALDEYRKRVERDGILIIKSHDETIEIKMSEIIFCEAMYRKTLLHTTRGEIEFSRNIKEIENKLPKSRFFRCGKAYIISFEHIKSFNNSAITMSNGFKAYIGRNYLAALRAAFQEYVLQYNMEKM